MKTPLFYAFEVSLNYVPESLRFLQAQFHFQSFASLQLEKNVVQRKLIMITFSDLLLEHFENEIVPVGSGRSRNIHKICRKFFP